jgi:hypothetical protein
MRIFTLAVRVLIVCFGLCLTGCFSTPLGEGWKARAGYRDSAPVILALERFHEDHKHYPDDLNGLVPDYLKLLPTRRFGYHRDGDSFWLSFSYTGPGMNDCTYDSKTQTWHSRGYY